MRVSVAIVVVILAGCLTVGCRAPSPSGTLKVDPELRHLLDITRGVEAGKPLSERDWQKLISIYRRTDRRDIRNDVLHTMGLARIQDPERKEVMAQLAREEIAREPSISSIMVLRYVGDPSYKIYARQMMEHPDPATRELYRRAFRELIPK